MQLHQLKQTHPNKDKRTRVGRGGKRGTTSGKGTKGQRARSGHRIRPAVRDLIQRLHKLRGQHNRPQEGKAETLPVSRLEKLSVTTVTLDILKREGLVGPRVRAVKILGDGEVKRSFAVIDIPVSASAKAKIEAAKGTVK